MAKFKINYESVADANRILENILRELEEIEAQTVALKRSIDPDIQRRYNINNALSDARTQVSDTVLTGTKLLKLISSGAERYREVDTMLAQNLAKDIT